MPLCTNNSSLEGAKDLKFDRIVSLVFFMFSQIMNPDDLKARAAYLRQQRDRLLAMKKERRAEELDMFTSSSQSAARRAHSVQLAGSTSERPGSNKESRSSLSPQKRGNSTGILCSAIAGKLKKELEQS